MTTTYSGRPTEAGRNTLWYDTEEYLLICAPEVREHVSETPEFTSINVWPPEMRSQGIGRTLIVAAETVVKARGYGRVGLGVQLTHPPARRLY